MTLTPQERDRARRLAGWWRSQCAHRDAARCTTAPAGERLCEHCVMALAVLAEAS